MNESQAQNQKIGLSMGGGGVAYSWRSLLNDGEGIKCTPSRPFLPFSFSPGGGPKHFFVWT